MKDEYDLIPWVFVIGLPIFLLMEHPVIFWLVFVPLVVWLVVTVVRWLKSDKASMSGLFGLLGILVLILALGVIVCA